MAVPRQQRPSQRVVLLFGALIACVILLVLTYFAWSPANVERKKKYKPSKPEPTDLVEYSDVDESIAEDMVRELFLPISPFSARQHSLDELEELIKDIDIKTLPPVTIILRYHSSIDMLESQLANVHTQSIQPYSVWIVCATEDEKHFVERQKFPYPNVHIFSRNEKMVPLPSTEYSWVLDFGVLPGPRHLELLLKLNEAHEYHNTLVGTSALRIRWREDKVECHLGNIAKETTATVKMLNGAWLLRRQWMLAAALDAKPDGVPLGYWISRNLGAGGSGIPLINLPGAVEKNNDYILQGVSNKNECTMLEEYFKNSSRIGVQDKFMLSEVEDAWPQSTEAIVFLVDQDTMGDDWVQLACGMHDRPKEINSDIHIAAMSETIKCPSVPPYRIHNIDPGLQGTDVDRLTEMVQQLTQFFPTIDARVVIYMQDGGILHQAAEIAKSIVGNTVVMIGLPRESLPYIGWLRDLPASALTQWHSIRVKLVITTEGSDPKPFDRLYDSIQKSQLLGDKIDLMIYMESNLKKRMQRLVERTIWTYGSKDIRHRIVPAERASMFVEAWYPANNDEYAIVLDDGMELSPLFYIWAKYAILKYRYAMPREDHLYGISLSTPRLLDTSEEAHQLFMPPSDASYAPFLMQSPPSLGGGAIYFPEHWREFHDYINARVADNLGLRLQNVQVPELRSHKWTHSWRRYMDELIYLRGNVMLYPNFGNHASFATRTKLLDYDKTNATAVSISVLPFYTVPLVNASFSSSLPNQQLPEFSKLQILDIWGKPVRSLDALAERGRDLQKITSACSPPQEYLFDPSDLLCPFARVVEVPTDESNKTLPTKTITVYLSAHSST